MLVVAPNLTADRRLFLGRLEPGTVARPWRAEALPGGKPVNVARALRAHEVTAEMVALLPAESTGWLTARLAAEGLALSGVEYPGAVRDAVIVYEDSGRVTVLNCPGPELPAWGWERFVDLVAARARAHDMVVCAGSLPPGVPDDALSQLLAATHQAGARFLADAGPRWLAALLPWRPDLVSPNLAEAHATLAGGRGDSEPVEVHVLAEDQACRAAEDLVSAGARAALVTAGAAGVAYCDGESTGFVDALAVEVVNPISAGDSFLAGVAARLEAGDPLAEAVRWGVATASAAITQWLPGGAERELMLKLVDRVGAVRPR